MGFDATCYFSGILKLRTQKAVQSENDLHMHFLQHPLPPYTQLYPKPGVEGKQTFFALFHHLFTNHRAIKATLYLCVIIILQPESKWRTKPGLMQYPCPNDTVISEDKPDHGDCPQLHRLHGRTERDAGDARIREPNPQPPGSKQHGVEARSGSALLPDVHEQLPQEEQSGKALRVSRGPQVKVQKSSVNIVTSKAEKKEKKNPKAISSNGDTGERSTNIQVLHNPHAEQISK